MKRYLLIPIGLGILLHYASFVLKLLHVEMLNVQKARNDVHYCLPLGTISLAMSPKFGYRYLNTKGEKIISVVPIQAIILHPNVLLHASYPRACNKFAAQDDDFFPVASLSNVFLASSSFISLTLASTTSLKMAPLAIFDKLFLPDELLVAGCLAEPTPAL